MTRRTAVLAGRLSKTVACVWSLALAACAALPGGPVTVPLATPLANPLAVGVLSIPSRPEPADYYQGAAGLSGEALLQALKQRISQDHTDLGYNGARDVMFADIDDPSDTDTLVSVYAGRVAHGVHDRPTANNQQFATEHTWPQSLGAGHDAEKADLHHLFPVDSSANSIRNNNPFGLVTSAKKVIKDLSYSGQACKLGTDVQGTQVFEPSDWHKGDVARALMYFYIRYALPAPGEKGPGPLSLRNFKVEKQVLLAWHRLDPVDADEVRRNDRIFAAQGNRNPFVDHPEFVQKAGAAFAPEP